MIRLKGERVIIRPLLLEELDLVIEGRTQLGREALPSGPPDPARLQARIRHSDAFHNREILLGIETDGRLVGDIQTYRPPDRPLPPAVYEFGLALYDPADRGKGLGTEATRLFVDWLFGRGAERIQGGTAITNQPMHRVFEKLGFRPVRALEVGGVKELMYEVTRNDLRS